jgi:mannose-6-phosphate isomerase-like protein (cupin superfamily)
MEKKIKIVYEEDIIPSKFRLRDTARLITKERENSDLCSLHVCTIPAPFTSPEIVYEEDEILYLIEGEGTMIFDGKAHDFRPGTAVFIPKGCKYTQQARKDLKVLVIIAPPRLRSQWAGRPDLILLEPEDAVIKR